MVAARVPQKRRREEVRTRFTEALTVVVDHRPGNVSARSSNSIAAAGMKMFERRAQSDGML